MRQSYRIAGWRSCRTTRPAPPFCHLQLNMSPFQNFATRLLRSTPLTELTRHLEFELEGVPRFGFVPGQWLSMKTYKPDGEEITRAYSIASPPDESNHFALCLNRVQDGFMSNFLC